MAHPTLEEMIAVARTLPPEDQRRLRQWLEEQERRKIGQEPPAVAADQTANRRVMELRWLEEHEAEYAGQWLALDGDRLLAKQPVFATVAVLILALGIGVNTAIFNPDFSPGVIN